MTSRHNAVLSVLGENVYHGRRSLIGITQALYLTPLAVPVVFVLIRYVKARTMMIRAVSQMAMECGWPNGMPKTEAKY